MRIKSPPSIRQTPTPNTPKPSSLFAFALGCLLALAAPFFPHAVAQSPSSPQTSAQTAPSSASIDVRKILPKGSRIVLHAADFSKFWKVFQQTPLFQMISEQELQPLLKHVTTRLLGFREVYSYRRGRPTMRKSVWQRAQALSKQLTGFTVSESIRIFRGPHAIALVGIPKGSEPIQLAGVLGLDDPAKAQLLLNTILQRLPVGKATYAHQGVQVQVLRGLENAFHYAFLGDRCLLATTRKVMQTMIDNAKGGPQNLLADQQYAHFLKKVSLEDSGSIYVAADALLRDIAVYIGTSRNMVLSLLGLDAWNSLGLAVGIKNNRFSTRLHIAFHPKAEVSGPSRLLALEPADATLLRTFPTHTLFASLVRVPWVKLWDDALAAMKKMQPDAHQRFTETLGQFERAILRVSVREVIQALGESSAIYLYPYQDGGMFPQMTMVAQLHKPKMIQDLLKTLTGMIGVKIKQHTYRGVTYSLIRPGGVNYSTIRKLPSTFRSLGYAMLGWGSIELCYAFVGNQLWFALTPQTLKNFIDEQKQAQTPARKALLAKVAELSKDAGAWVYLDSRRITGLLYNTLMATAPFVSRSLGHFGGGLFRRFPLSLLPRSQTFIRHMNPVTFRARHAQHNTLMEIRSGLGVEALLVGAGTAAAASKLFLQFRINRYVSNVIDFLKLEKASKVYLAKGHFNLAARRWRDLARRSLFEAVALTARKQAAQYEALSKQRQQQIQQALEKLYANQLSQLQQFQFKGDWAYNDGMLRAITGRYNGASLYFGHSKLSTYVLQFEVRNPSKGFRMGLNLGSRESVPHAYGYAPRYRSWRSSYYRRRRHFQSNAIAFRAKQFQEGAWIPVKIKVKGRRVSYWFGIKHHILNTNKERGRIGLAIPGGGQFELRNIKLEVPAAKAPQTGSPQQLYPSLGLELRATSSSIEVGETTTYRLTVHNYGQLPARKLVVRFRLSNHLTFLSGASQPSLTTVASQEGQDIAFSPVVALEGGQGLRLQIQVKAAKAGSALAIASIQFAQMKGEIAISGRIHITRDPAQIAPPSQQSLPRKTTAPPTFRYAQAAPIPTAHNHAAKLGTLGLFSPHSKAAPTPVKSGLSRDAIRRVIRRNQRRFRYCYERQLMRNPKLQGRVTVSFTINALGRVSGAYVSQTTLKNSATEQCLLRRFRYMRFPAPTGGGLVRVNYPLVFRSR